MKAEFTEIEKETLKGKIRSLARKHGVSNTHIHNIVSGKTEIKTDLALKIYDDLKHVAEFFQPKNAS